MIRAILLFLLFAFSGNLISQNNKTFFLGHSLVNFNMPNMVNKLSIAGSKTYSYNLNVGNGANLLTHWTNPHSGGSQGNWWDTTLNKPGFDNFILTEAVPLLGHLLYSNTYRYADSLYRFAKTANPNIQYYIYETWHCTTTGTPTGCPWDNDDALAWRPRLTADLPKWEGIADSINLLHPQDMLVVPAGQALAQLHDSITANKVPGITSINQLFLDDIHLTLTGNYFIACVMYGIIHKTSPEGLPNQLTDEWGTPYTTFPTTVQAGIFQRIAWRTLCTYPRDGVTCATTDLSEPAGQGVNIFPNPFNEQIMVSGPGTETIKQISIYEIQGKKVYSQSIQPGYTINTSEMHSGMFILEVTLDDNSKIRKKVVKEAAFQKGR